MDELEQKIRRSSRLKDSSTFRQLLAYASMVQDQDQVYAYMDENKIGMNEPELWAAKLTMLKNRGEYAKFVKILKKVHRNQELKKHPKYWLIVQIENQLENYLERLLRRKAKGKRSAREYETLNYGDIEKQTRKFGKIEVYVDPECRKQYRLEDLVSFVSERLPDECEFQRNCYLRQIGTKPLSFIGKEKAKLDKKMSSEILDIKENRDSNKRKTNQRISLVGRKSNKQEGVQYVQTPDFKKKSFSKESRRKQKAKPENLSQLDSIQILKNFARRSIVNSSRDRSEENPEFDAGSPISSVKKEKVRNPSNEKSEDIFSEPDMDVGHELIFSFAIDSKFPSSEQKNNRKSQRISQNRDRKEKQIHNLNHSSKDFAFIEQTQTENPMNELKKNIKQSEDLENVIKEIQMQKYESQTFSEIDSNKENNFLLGEEDSLSVNFNGIQSIKNRQIDHRERKKFETIKKEDRDRNRLKSGHNESQQEPQSNEMDESSQVIYKELLSYLDGKSNTQEDPNLNSMSEKNRKKRISRISEERSYSFSETRPRSRSNT